jgi:dihydroxyacetone kinase DhaKLM complex PTS-EIIA-like component DhaM
MKRHAPYILIFSILITSCGTVDTNPLESQVPTKAIETPIINESLALPTTNIELQDFTNKEFVGEDDNYSIYLVNSNNDNENVKTGEIIVYIKSSNQIIKINGSFTVIMKGTIVYDDGTGEYIFLSIGSSPVRRAIVISLKDKKQAIQELCITSGYTEGLIFWKKNIVKSDEKKQYQINAVEGNYLIYIEEFVYTEEDWANVDMHQVEEKSIDISIIVGE